MRKVGIASGALGVAILSSWAVTGGYSAAGSAQMVTDVQPLPIRSVDAPHREKIVALSDPFAAQVRATDSSSPSQPSASHFIPLSMPLPPRLNQPGGPDTNLSNLQVPGPDGSLGGPGGFAQRGRVQLYATTTTFAEVSVDSGPLMIVRVGNAVGTKRIRAIYGFDGAIELNDGTRITIDSSAATAVGAFGAPQGAALTPGAPAFPVLPNPANGMTVTLPHPSIPPQYTGGPRNGTRAGQGPASGSMGQGGTGATGGTGVMVEPDPKPSDSLRPSTLPIHD